MSFTSEQQLAPREPQVLDKACPGACSSAESGEGICHKYTPNLVAQIDRSNGEKKMEEEKEEVEEKEEGDISLKGKYVKEFSSYMPKNVVNPPPLGIYTEGLAAAKLVLKFVDLTETAVEKLKSSCSALG
ncbi:hypothetical protein AAES_87423 [Amazona aestiva]|uniref:Uncharacterized protein n=1 Tax=Amazona aestiva TaxID=12930 RepID=A0A0Q3PT54_AMAAE|nr:hypothetical protein AAES_87423 [Amazona aestiva]